MQAAPWQIHRQAMISKDIGGLYEVWEKPDQATEWLTKAETLFREALEELLSSNSGGALLIATWRSDLGESLTKLGRHAEAEHELLEAHRSLISIEKNNWRVQKTVERLVSLYEAWGKPEKAAESRALLPQ